MRVKSTIITEVTDDAGNAREYEREVIYDRDPVSAMLPDESLEFFGVASRFLGEGPVEVWPVKKPDRIADIMTGHVRVSEGRIHAFAVAAHNADEARDIGDHIVQANKYRRAFENYDYRPYLPG